jgi:hypothetical protein
MTSSGKRLSAKGNRKDDVTPKSRTVAPHL